MFGTLGGPELFLIFVVALIVFGPRKLPEIGKSLGRMMSEFRRASNDFRSTIESEVEAEKIRESMRIEPPRARPAPSSTTSSAAGGSEASSASSGGEGPSPAGSSGEPEPKAAHDDATSAPSGSQDPPATSSPSASPEPDAGADPGGGPDREAIPETVGREEPSPRPVEPK